MKYLFFDTECANVYDNKGKLCEFGCVLTDGQFRVERREHWLINPDAPFDWYVLKNILSFRKGDYLAAPRFGEVYPAIAERLSQEELLIAGYSVTEDVDYLNDECRRLGLPFLSYRCLDVRRLYAAWSGTKKHQRLEEVCALLELPPEERLHCSLDDAEATMRVARALCERTGQTLQTLAASCPGAWSMTENGRARSLQTPRREKQTRREGGDPT